MKFFRMGDERTYAKAKKRLDTVPGLQVQAWADTSLWAVQEGLEGYRSVNDRAALEQARTGIVGLLAAVDSLLDRTP